MQSSDNRGTVLITLDSGHSINRQSLIKEGTVVGQLDEDYSSEELDNSQDKLNASSEDYYLFYSNYIPCQPGGYFIADILANWKGNYNKLENDHGYSVVIPYIPEKKESRSS